MKQFEFDVVKTIAVLSEKDNYSKRLTMTAWNGNIPVLDLRTWKREKDGSMRPLKGVTLDEDETSALMVALVERD